MPAFEGRSAMEGALEEAIRVGSSLDCTEVEAFASSVDVKQVVVEHNVCNTARLSQECSLFVRAAVGKRVGVSFVNSLARADVKDCCRRAVRFANLRQEDSSWGGFPGPVRNPSTVQGLVHKSVERLEVRHLVGFCEDMVGAALDAHRSVQVAGAAVTVTDSARAVANTSGINAFSRSAMLGAHCTCVSGRGSGVTPECSEAVASRKADTDFRSLGESAADIAVLSLKRARPVAGKYEVVFSPFALGYADNGFLKSILSSAFSGEGLVHGKTFLANLVGDEISSEALTVRDNPLSPSRCGSRSFDDEGVSTERTMLIDSGVLKGFLWDSSSASLANTKSTGNARRDPTSGALAVQPNNMEIVPSRLSWRELCEDVRHGYLVWSCQGGHTGNSETGNYSFVPSPGMLIENGEIAGGIQGAMVSGNILDLLGKVDAVGGDTRDMQDCLMPSIRFRDVRIDTS